MNNKEYKIDPRYKITNRLIDCTGIDNIKAIEPDYINYEVLSYETQSECRRAEEAKNS